MAADAAAPAVTAASPGKSNGLTTTRRVVAGAFLLAWVVVAWISYQTPYLQACSDQVVRVGSAPLVRACDPLSLLDAPMLVLLVAGVLLLLPDVSAIEVPGIFRLERQVAEQARRQDELTRMIQDVKLDIRSHQKIDFKPIIVTAANEAAETATAIQRLIYAKPDKDRDFAQEGDEPPEQDEQDERSDAADTP